MKRSVLWDMGDLQQHLYADTKVISHYSVVEGLYVALVQPF